jgi:hypothetical protein
LANEVAIDIVAVLVTVTVVVTPKALGGHGIMPFRETEHCATGCGYAESENDLPLVRVENPRRVGIGS